MVYKNNKKASEGIGTLVIFIALILVAAVAAGVLIQTASSLQGKASTTGKQVQQRIATGFTVIQVVANNTDDGEINATTDQIAVTAQLSPGSDAIKLSDILFTLVTKEGTASYKYNGGGTTHEEPPASATGTGNFTVTWVKGPTLNGYISGPDVATFSFRLPNYINISENEDFTIRAFPGVGNPQPIQVVTPPAMVQKYTVLR